MEKKKIIFSSTKLGTIARCPRLYYFMYENKDIKIPTNFKFAFGIAVHSMLEKFYTINFKSVDSFIKYWKRYWYSIREGVNKRIGFVPVPREEARNYIFGHYSGLGKRILANFWKRDEVNKNRFHEQKRQALKDAKLLSAKAKRKKEFLKSLDLFPASEKHVRFSFEGFDIQGKIDRIDYYKDGLAFFDYKTDKRKSSPDDLMVLKNPNHQFTIYDLAMKKAYPEYKLSGRFLIHLRTLAKDPMANPFIPVRKNAVDFNELALSLEKANRIINEKEFDRNVGYHCIMCDCYDFCVKEVLNEYANERERVMTGSIQKLEDEIEKYWEDQDSK